MLCGVTTASPPPPPPPTHPSSQGALPLVAHWETNARSMLHQETQLAVMSSGVVLRPFPVHDVLRHVGLSAAWLSCFA